MHNSLLSDYAISEYVFEIECHHLGHQSGLSPNPEIDKKISVNKSVWIEANNMML